jgi:hypothetical protein
MTDITITDFDLSQIDERRRNGSAPVILVIGSRGKGKSTIARAIMRSLRSIPMGNIFSSTETCSPFYSENVPSLFIYSTLDLRALKTVVDEQKKTEKRRSVFILIDDMMYDPLFLRTPIVKGIFLNGRHWGITLLLTTQYAIDVPPALRGNVDYVFLMRENNLQTCAKLHKNFGGIFPTTAVFNQAMRACTVDFGSLVLDFVNDRAFRFRVDMEEEKEPFRMFADSVWRYAEQHTCRSEEEHDIVTQDSSFRIMMPKK